MDIKFEGDIGALTPESEQVCLKALKDKGYTKCTVQVETVGKKGDNYVANVKRFIAQEDNINEGKPFKMIGKIAPTIEQLRQIMSTDIAFTNEIIVYSELLPRYDKLQEAVNIPQEERLKYPLCYGSYSEPPKESIFLEDLNESDFVMLNRFISLNDEQIKLALKELAKFHGLSYVLKEEDLDFFNQMKTKLVNIWIILQDSEEMKQFVTLAEEEIQSMLKNQDYKMRIKGIMCNLTKSSYDIHIADINSKFSAIVQGDCWTNNMMFKLKNNKAVEIILLDHQIARVASPATDVLYLILNCTDYETRSKHFDDWIDYYHKSLEEFLSHFGMKATYVYPKEKLYADLLRNGRHSLGMSCMMANMLVREPEDVIDFKEDPLVEMTPDLFSVSTMREEIADRLNTKLEGLIQSCIDFGYV